ncbi:peptidase M61 [Variovorax dokdonensis]|uniref:Peptidase M61 n=1 Tax=Variovorax dokdonensis TaxID=344883 RepID=A0ABT7N592_9BURK|nr:peptidase M61 [Variovorax dokdonensis]MDM0043098.1 peptidase M61 [Variovorax dokdonensis]
MASHRAPIAYRVACADRHAHLFEVQLQIENPAASQRVSLPAWIPGSYLIREFAKDLQGLQAKQGRRSLALAHLDKATWQVECKPGQPLVMTWQVCAHDNSVRTAWLDDARGFFNSTSLCLRVEGQTDVPHALEVVAPTASAGEARWQCATALAPLKVDRHGFGSYLAADYDELADSPVEMGAFWSGSFDAGGVAHRFVVAGAAPTFNGEKLLADTQAICEAQMQLWHGDRVGRRGGSKPPHDRYVFMLNVVDDGYGGLEHRHSTALICARRDLPRIGETRQTEGYTTLLGLISHEYFHTWNVKRLRPAEFAAYDYASENYTRLLWFFEGFTSYYDDLVLRRSNRIDDATYLRLITKTINQVLQTPGREVQSVAQASFDAWVKYYRQDEQTPNLTVSYYTKGALVALCLDLTLRAEGKGTLDDVMRLLWTRSDGGPIAEADIAAALAEVGHRSFSSELDRWVHGTGELPLTELLIAHGVAALDEPAQPAQRLGLRVAETNGAVQVKVVLRGGAAEKAGFAAGDEWLGVEVTGNRGRPAQAWRIAKLEDLALYLGPDAKTVTAIVARDRRLLRLPLQLPAGITTWRLAVQDARRMSHWLGGAVSEHPPTRSRSKRQPR